MLPEPASSHPLVFPAPDSSGQEGGGAAASHRQQLLDTKTDEDVPKSLSSKVRRPTGRLHRHPRPAWRDRGTTGTTSHPPSAFHNKFHCRGKVSYRSVTGVFAGIIMSGGARSKIQVPRPLADLKKKQIVFIAKEQFDTALHFNDRWGDLADDLTNLMNTVTECHSSGCDGGPCNPALHLFQPHEYLPPVSTEASVVEALLQTTQNDQQITPSSSPSLQPADGPASRAALHQAAMSQIETDGATGGLADIEEEDEEDTPLDSRSALGPASSSSSQARAGGRLSNGVRNLLNSLMPPTPRIDSPRLGTPAVRQPIRPAGQGQVQPRFPNNTPTVRQPTPGTIPARHIPPPRPVQAQASGSNGDLMSTVDQLMALVKSQQEESAREREEERSLRNEQIRNTNALAAVLEKFADKSMVSDPATTSAVSKGRVSMVPHANPTALALTGCAVAPKFAIIGDPASVDLKEARHKIKSGRNVGVTLDARISESWPNEYLCPLMMDGIDPKQFDHDKISLIQWAGGFASKIFAEFPEDRNETKEHNQLFMLMKMLRLAETQPWHEIMKINQALFSALERGVLTWLSREALEKWWRLARETLNDRAARPQPTKRTPAAPAPGQPPAKRPDTKRDRPDKKNDVFGVPGDFLRQKNICIRWNVSSCSDSNDTHPSPDRSATAAVRHVCGGCAYLGKPDDTSHPMKSCRWKGGDGIFRQQG